MTTAGGQALFDEEGAVGGGEVAGAFGENDLKLKEESAEDVGAGAKVKMLDFV